MIEALFICLIFMACGAGAFAIMAAIADLLEQFL